MNTQTILMTGGTGYIGGRLIPRLLDAGHKIRAMAPVDLIGTRETIRMALDRIRQEQVDTCWFDGGGALPPEWTTCGDADYAGGTVLRGGHLVVLEATAEEVWNTIEQIGGPNGWYFAQPLCGSGGGWTAPLAALAYAEEGATPQSCELATGWISGGW